MKKFRYKKKSQEIYPFKWTLEVIVTQDVQEYAKHFNLPTDYKPLALHVGDAEKSKSEVIFAEEGCWGEVAHEAYHVIRAILRSRRVGSSDEEMVAYFLEDIVNTIATALDDMKKMKKRYFVVAERKNK